MEKYDYWNHSVKENALNDNGFEMGMEEEVHFEPPNPSPCNETSWCSSSSSEDYNMEGFYQLDKQQSVSMTHQSAFNPYITTHSNGVVNSSKMGQILFKRCVMLLSRIEKRRKLEIRMSSSKAAPDSAENIEHQSPDSKLATRHMIAERKRRQQFKQLFSALHSLLPPNSKKNKHSILANAAKYLSELKVYIAQLEQRNQTLEESIDRNNISADATLVYQSHEDDDEVTLEQFNHIPCRFKIRLNVNKNRVSCFTNVLMKLLERLGKGAVEVLSINSHMEANGFQASIVIQTKGDGWDASKFLKFGDALRGSLLRTFVMKE